MRRSAVVLVLVAVFATACAQAGEPVLVEGTVAPTATPTATPVPPTPTPAPTATPVPTPTPTCTQALPVRQAAAQLVVTLATPGELGQLDELAEAGEVSGVVVLGAPSTDQIAAIPIADVAGVPMIIGSDEEGGRVQRLSHLLGALPAASTLAGIAVEEVTETFKRYGTAMAQLGFTLVLAPVIDVGGGPGIGDRALSEDPQVVIEHGAAIIDGYQASGLVPVLKHFPGHGSGSADSHLGFSTTPPLSELRERDLLPYEALLSDDLVVLVGHLLVPGLDEDTPASLSVKAIAELLRQELGFDGVVMTDSLGMNAVSDRWTNEEAATLAVAAGVDLVLVDAPGQVVPVVDALVAAHDSGQISRDRIDESLDRVLALKGIDPCAIGLG
ncbi:MAG: glycoside hydrolase family 3 N-terminal domain-containing protein [Acidimicrobiales bacterium]